MVPAEMEGIWHEIDSIAKGDWGLLFTSGDVAAAVTHPNRPAFVSMGASRK